MKRKLYIILIALSVAGTSCKDYLTYDYPIDGTISPDQIWVNEFNARNFLNEVYEGLGNSSDYFNKFNQEMNLSSASDEAVTNNLTSPVYKFTNGSWGPTNLVDDQYQLQYENLRRANLFLENAPTSALQEASDLNDLMGQAYFLRAFYHFELMERYGAIILAKKSFSFNENLDLPKNTFQEVVDFIVADCDLAIANIVAINNPNYAVADRGRATKAAAMALKSRVLLYAASPLHNPSNDVAKWQLAADAAKTLIDISAANNISLLPQAQLPILWNWTAGAQVFSREIIFAAATTAENTMDFNNAPPSYDGGRGRTNPTQQFVDAFEMRTTGRPINDPLSGYMATDPYNNRDNRLQFFVNYHYNPLKWRSSDIDIRVGAKDNNPGVQINRTTRTGYYMRKFLSDAARYGTGGNAAVRRAWVFFRYAEILLNYAEALNEAQGPVPAVYTNINLVRVRAGLPALQSTNPAGNGYIPATKEALRERIHNERRVELCFEEHRFFDIRRWKEGNRFLNGPVTGVSITGAVATSPTYTYSTVENRIFADRMYLFPFPQLQINITENLEQNSGW